MEQNMGRKPIIGTGNLDEALGPDIESTNQQLMEEEEFHDAMSVVLNGNGYVYLKKIEQGRGAPYACTDVGNANRLVLWHGRELLFNESSMNWLLWDGKRWCVTKGHQIMMLAIDTAKKIHEEVKAIGEGEPKKKLADHATKSENRGKLWAMINLAIGKLAVSSQQLDSDPWAFNVLNGTLDLQTGELYSHRKADRITRIAPVNFEKEGVCPTWMGYMSRIMNGNRALIDYLQRAIGYSLTGFTKEQVLFLLVGPRATGKSTFLETIRYVLGDYARNTPFSSFLVTRGEGIRNDLARLPGVRFVTASEITRGKQLDETIIKALTGEDNITARFLFKEYFEYKPNFKIFLAANYKPEIRNTDEAIWQRIRLIPFNVSIPEDERDKELKDKLRAEGAGILSWAVRGCLDWQKIGLGTPPEVKEATVEYRQEMDILGDFLNENCVLGAGERVQAKDLYGVYTSWCKETGQRPLTQKMLGIMLKERGFQRRRGAPVVYLGIGIKKNHTV